MKKNLHYQDIFKNSGKERIEYGHRPSGATCPHTQLREAYILTLPLQFSLFLPPLSQCACSVPAPDS